MDTNTKLAKYQSDMARYCRTGEEIKVPGIRTDRLHYYRELVFNVVSGTLEQNFPILLQVVGDEKFEVLVDDFIRNHPCQTAQIWKLSKEFYEYGLKANWSKIHQLPWINDLLCIEWAETEVFTMPNEPIPSFKPYTNSRDEILVVNPEFLLLQLAYPVHLYPVSQAATKAGEYYVLVYRHLEAGTVHFEDVSVLYAELLLQLSQSDQTVGTLVEQLANKYQMELTDEVVDAIHGFLFGLYQTGFVLGARE